MSEIKSIVCDCCGKEMIVDSQYPHKWGFHLEVRDYGINTSGSTFLVGMTPPMDGPKDFCKFDCLLRWVKEKGGECPICEAFAKKNKE